MDIDKYTQMTQQLKNIIKCNDSIRVVILDSNCSGIEPIEKVKSR